MEQKNQSQTPITEHVFGFLFNLLYNQMAWLYDLVAWIVSAGLWKDWVFSILPYIKGKRILELGHGPGHLQEAGLRLQKKFYGIDTSPNMIKICYKRLKSAGLTPAISQANAMDLPFADESFTQIVATFPAPYIFQKKTLSEIHRVLTQKGELLIIPTAWSTSKFPIQRFFSWLFNFGTSPANLHENFENHFQHPLRDAGFQLSQQVLKIKNSNVLLITAKKL